MVDGLTGSTRLSNRMTADTVLLPKTRIAAAKKKISRLAVWGLLTADDKSLRSGLKSQGTAIMAGSLPGVETVRSHNSCPSKPFLPTSILSRCPDV
jgi:hypothetical protein